MRETVKEKRLLLTFNTEADCRVKNEDAGHSKKGIKKEKKILMKVVRRKRKNIEESEKGLQGLFDAIPLALFTHDEEFRIIRANKEYANLAGMSVNDMQGKVYYEVFPRRKKPFGKCKDEVLKLQQQEEELFMPEKNQYYRMIYYPVLDHLKKYRFSVHIIENITEKKCSEEQIRNMREEWRLIFDSIKDAIAIQSREQRLIRVNKAYADFLKTEPEKLVGKFCYETIHKAECPCSNCLHRQTLETGNPSEVEFYEPESGGFLQENIIPIVNKKDEIIGTMHIVKNITERKRSEMLLRISESTLRVQKLSLEQKNLELKQLYMGTIKSLANAIDEKSHWTRGHSERVTAYAVHIGREMGLNDSELDDLRIAGLLHDIGKIGTSDCLLEKPGKLNKYEYEVVKKHPCSGAELLTPIKELEHIIPWIRHHHERFDGKGYPDGLKGEEIPLQARMLAVADAYDSMTADRPYRETPGNEKAISELNAYAGIQFDPGIVEAFFRILKKMKKKILNYV